MSTQDTFSFMQMWGYYLEPKPHPFSPGYAGIAVAVRAKPTHQHFDPEALTLWMLNSGGVERTHLGLQSHGMVTKRICPGRVSLTDRYAKRTDFYTYGATLSMMGGRDETIYRFESDAPILWLAEDENDFPEQLDAETEAILAGIHTKWRRQDALFAQRLVELKPIDLYLATLRSIDERYTQSPALKGHFYRFYENLQREILWQRSVGNLKDDGPLLETLLPPPQGIF